jgi:poly(A)-specific ribonuclease
MGFTLVVEELIAARKPVVGHNMIYDIFYLYNQFIDDMPPTYLEFVNKWNPMFPSVYDNKVVSSAAEYFGRTDLGKVYEKCLNDEKIKAAALKISFDLKNGFTNYEGSELLSHYHEAAYDAFMTGFAFANILKFKEFDKGKQASGKAAAAGKAAGKAKEEEKVVEVRDSTKLNYEHGFAVKYFNKIMLNSFNMEFYDLDPAR